MQPELRRGFHRSVPAEVIQSARTSLVKPRGIKQLHHAGETGARPDHWTLWIKHLGCTKAENQGVSEHLSRFGVQATLWMQIGPADVALVGNFDASAQIFQAFIALVDQPLLKDLQRILPLQDKKSDTEDASTTDGSVILAQQRRLDAFFSLSRGVVRPNLRWRVAGEWPCLEPSCCDLCFEQLGAGVDLLFKTNRVNELDLLR